MSIDQLLKNKEIKAKEKTEIIANTILNNELSISTILDYCQTAKDKEKATCMEAFEYVTSQKPELSSTDLLKWAESNLDAKAPRLQWESAKVIGNIAHLYAESLESAIPPLVKNAKHKGTVIRWSAAYALANIFEKVRSTDSDFRSMIVDIHDSEEKASIKKIYAKALKNK